MERLQSDKDKNKLLTFNSFYLETDNFKIYICYTFLGDAFMTEIRKDASEPSMLIYMPRQFKNYIVRGELPADKRGLEKETKTKLWSTEYRVGHLLKIIPLFNQKYFTNFA